MTVKHAHDCGWHLDQYDWECTCGARVRSSLDRLEQLASPDALVIGDTAIAGEFCRIMNARGFLRELRCGIDKICPPSQEEVPDLSNWFKVGPGTPLHAWLETKRFGEDGQNVCMAFIPTIGSAVEWVEKDTGVDTIICGTFAPPTHWRFP